MQTRIGVLQAFMCHIILWICLCVNSNHQVHLNQQLFFQRGTIGYWHHWCCQSGEYSVANDGVGSLEIFVRHTAPSAGSKTVLKSYNQHECEKRNAVVNAVARILAYEEKLREVEITKLNDEHAVAIAMLNDKLLKVQQEAAALRRKAAEKDKVFTTVVDRLNDENG